MAQGFLGDCLIFIISQRRAGSTLLQRVLAGHPLVQTSAEPWLLLHPVNALREKGIQTECGHDGTYVGLGDFLAHYADGKATYLDAVRAMAQVLYDRALQGTGSTCFLDKTPRYCLIISEHRDLFPEAAFIFLLRYPLAVFCSAMSVWPQDQYWPHLASRFDLILLGLGEDEHVAALFPGSTSLRASSRLAVASYVPRLKNHRLILTLPVLNSSRCGLFIVSGESKPRALSQAWADTAKEPPLPVQIVQAQPGDLIWLVDGVAHASGDVQDVLGAPESAHHSTKGVGKAWK
jgi:hypothetical protein